MTTKHNATTHTTTATTPVNLSDALARLGALRDELNTRFLEASERIDMVLISLLARQHCLMLGPAGEAKSAITDAVMARITGAQVYKTQVFRTTTPDELYGMWNPQEFKQGRYQRVTDGMLPQAHLAFLDETFKASSALLNALLMAMNERQFRNGARIEHLPLVSVIGASNELPQGDELGALWDRFLMRQWVEPLTRAGRRQFVADELTRRTQRAAGASSAAVAGQTGATLSLDELAALQTATLGVVIPDAVRAAYWQIEDALEAKGLPTTSTRRLGWLWDIVAASALLHGRTSANEDDLLPLRHALWQERQHIREVSAVVFQAASPIVAEATSLYDMTLAEVNEALAVLSAPAKTREDELKRDARSLEAARKLATAKNDMLKLYQRAKGAGRDTTDIQRMGKDLEAKRLQLAAAQLGDDPTAQTTTW